MSGRTQRRVVCAACKMPPGEILLGSRHWDPLMHRAAMNYYECDYGNVPHEQGFIDQWGEFMTREQAWKVAEAAGQIIYRCGGDTANGGTLYSENLY